MIKIDNTNVFGLEEAVVASGLPMLQGYSETKFAEEVDKMRAEPSSTKHIVRATTLAGTKIGTGHDNYLCGIIVQANISAPLYWWPQLQRYSFVDIVSSTSTMHTLVPTIKKCLEVRHTDNGPRLWDYFSSNTPTELVVSFMTYAEKLLRTDTEPKKLLKLLRAALPSGWMQTARITTNYRQLKTIYAQRSNHTLDEWRDMCAWMQTLPCSPFITK